MTFEILSALILFALVTSATPGPNNLMLMASGANYGFTPSIPHILRITIGSRLIILLWGAGLAQSFVAYPASHTIPKISSTSCGANPIDGSSSRIVSGFDIKARPIAVICCSPPEV